MGKKRKIKSRKDRLSLYKEKTKGIPRHDPVERLMYCLGDKLTLEKVQSAITRKEKILSEITYSYFKITYYEYPVGSERPRSRLAKGFVTNYVPNAKDNRKYLEGLIEDIKEDIKVIHTPIYITCHAYHQMPEDASVEEKILFEAGLLPPVVTPDYDNMVKAYTDMMLEQIILDDDLVYKAKIEKGYSFLPRVELCVYYQDQFTSKYVYNRIRKRESFKRLVRHMDMSTII